MFIIKADGLAMSNAQYFSLMFEDPWHSRCYFYFLWPYVTTWRTLPIVKLFLLPNSGAYLYSAEGMTLISHRSQYQYSVGFCFYEKLIFPINHPPIILKSKNACLNFISWMNIEIGLVLHIFSGVWKSLNIVSHELYSLSIYENHCACYNYN